MNRRNSRVQQILKNAGVIHSSDDDSDYQDVIENTPDGSPKYYGDIVASSMPSYLEGITKKANSTLTNEHISDKNEERTVISVSTSLIQKQVFEIGEISIEAPAYSPITPKQASEKSLETCNGNVKDSAQLPCTFKQIEAPGEISIEAPDFSPLTPRQIIHNGEIRANCSPLHPDNQFISPVPSPMPSMSPETSKVFNMLIGTEQDDDDSVVDPNYEVEHLCNDSLDESEIDEPINRRKEKRDNNDSPSILRDIFEKSDQDEDKQNLNGDTPKKRKKRNPDNWKVNIEKRKKLRGESYKTKKGKNVEEKSLKPAKCIASQKHKCIQLIPEDQRVRIYTEFRKLTSLQEQRYFVVNHVTKQKKNRDTTQGNSRRNFTLIYTLTNSDEKKVVCREFFLDTLNISDGFVKGALKKINSEGLLLPDYRGKKAPPNKTTAEEEKFMRDHILSFPSVESHYCRKNSQICYLDSTLTLTEMYRKYKKECETKLVKAVCMEKYRSSFKTYKLSFHKPKKDLCKHCKAYKEMSEEEKANKEEAHALHLLRKNAARTCRDEDKEEAKIDDSILAFNFDLEAVLTTPKGATGPFFYVRKLAVYNLTIYNTGNQDVECYLWDETEGKRGAIEISTCVYTYIMAHNNIKQVKMMSDGAGGQQKNYHFCSMCLVAVTEHPTLQVIDHKFFETGHTHMECDSIHSKIENKSKHVPVYTPDDWAQIIRLARTNPRPFSVTTLLHDDFKDFGTQNQFQSKVNHGPKLGISEAVWLQYRKEDPDTIYLKNSYDINEPFALLVQKKRRGKSISNYPTAAYSQRQNISLKKKNDLMKLCSDLQIPRNYHDFYKNLPCSETARDALPEPDITEDSD